MPNGHDKNWIRLCITLAGFRARYGRWPTCVHVFQGLVTELRDHLLPANAFDAVMSRLRFIEDGSAFIAEDDNGHRFEYGDETGGGTAGEAEAWLGATTRPSLIEDDYVLMTPQAESDVADAFGSDGSDDSSTNAQPLLRAIDYTGLNARQKENFNFQKLSAVLADFGFVTLRLNDDWQGADFIAQHVDGFTFLRVQLKGRFAIGKKYQNKGLYLAFFEAPHWYLYPHDEVLPQVLARTSVGTTRSWVERGGYSFPRLTAVLERILEPYRIPKLIPPGESPIPTND